MVHLFELGLDLRMPLTVRRLLDAELEPLWATYPQWRVLEAPAIAWLTGHGDVQRWNDALAAMPDASPSGASFDDVVTIGERDDLADAERGVLERALAVLHPWRKGPFSMFGIRIDAEWRSDWKWRRIAPHLQPLEGRRVLDVGCGNGYYGWRMCASGASLVVGVEANPVHVMQHLAMCRYLAQLGFNRNCVLPVRFETLPASAPFDTVFSLGVLYHQHDPVAHLHTLRGKLREGGELVVETLVVNNADTLKIAPGERYARMRNVSCIPAESALIHWLQQAGFYDVRRVDLTATSRLEQRRTPWMTFDSFAEALDPNDGARTVEGHPAPLRAVLIARG